MADLPGGPFRDFLFGTEDADTMFGNRGDDYLIGACGLPNRTPQRQRYAARRLVRLVTSNQTPKSATVVRL